MRIKDMLSSLQIGQKQKELHNLTTIWGEAAAKMAAEDPDFVPLPEYPRPQLVRDMSWKNLNGWWEWRITSFSGKDLAELPLQVLTPASPWTAAGRILVPYSPEAPLSGVGRTLQPGELLWYRRHFFPAELTDGEMPGSADARRLLLHFGAVDQECIVLVNGKEAGRHLGGYLPFTLDITSLVTDGENTLEVICRDVSDTSYHTIGKQRLKPEGMYYTAQSGIWQTVWLEAVPRVYIREIRTDIDYRGRSVHVRAFVSDGSSVSAHLTIPEEDFQPWSPEDPYLYYAELSLKDKAAMLTLLPSEKSPVLSEDFSEKKDTKTEETAVLPSDPNDFAACRSAAERSADADHAVIYFAMRSFSTGLSKDGTSRFSLNGSPYFFNGVLDQGYWPEGLMTPPSDEAFIFDILSMKDAGMNLIRKHCKLEPLRWYYHCDRLGILVWQDIVNGGETVSTLEVTYLPTVIPPVQTNRGWNARACGRLNPEGRREHIAEIKATLRHLYNVPSLAGWVIFNEGWGQFSTVKLTRMVRELDPSRPIDAASGWYDFGTGDYKSVHNYFRTLEVPEDEFYSEFPRAAVISEYGGLAHPVPGHVRTDKIYGYQTITDPSELKDRFAALQAEIRQLGEEGLSGAIYTQVSDIEEEINGLLTYDRRVNKLKD